VVADLARRVRELRPHVAMTMGTEGAITAHPDHSMISVFATMACHWAGRTNRFPDQLENGLAPHHIQKLYYATALFTMPDRQPVALAPTTAIIELKPHEIDAKIAAFKLHTCSAFLKRPFASAARPRFSTWPTA
jgi:LmbE family N-acetylglucosaminyl deacetylase